MTAFPESDSRMPAKFCKVGSVINKILKETAQHGAYHNDDSVRSDDVLEVFPELESVEVTRDASAGETVVHHDVVQLRRGEITIRHRRSRRSRFSERRTAIVNPPPRVLDEQLIGARVRYPEEAVRGVIHGLVDFDDRHVQTVPVKRRRRDPCAQTAIQERTTPGQLPIRRKVRSCRIWRRTLSGRSSARGFQASSPPGARLLGGRTRCISNHRGSRRLRP